MCGDGAGGGDGDGNGDEGEMGGAGVGFAGDPGVGGTASGLGDNGEGTVGPGGGGPDDPGNGLTFNFSKSALGRAFGETRSDQTIAGDMAVSDGRSGDAGYVGAGGLPGGQGDRYPPE